MGKGWDKFKRWGVPMLTVGPEIGTVVGAGLEANKRNKDKLKGTGTQAPTTPFSPEAMNPTLHKGQGIQTGGGGSARGGYRQAAQAERTRRAEAAQGLTHAPSGWDMTGPGVSEQFYDRNQDRMLGPSTTEQAYGEHKQTFGTPGQGEQYWQQVQGKFNDPTNAQAAYQRAQARDDDPGLGAYYDRAKQQTANSMNDQLAAMGMLGSSVGAQKMGNALSALDAERANREADYVMRQDQLVGQLAGQADSQNQNLLGLGGSMASNAQGLGMGRAQAGMGAAQAVDSAEISRFNAGANAAAQAQGDRRTRVQDMFGNMFAPAAAMGQMVGDAQGDILSNDQAFMDAALAAENGMLADQVDTSRYKADRQKDDERHGMDMWGQIQGNIMGMGGGGGMGGMMGGGK